MRRRRRVSVGNTMPLSSEMISDEPITGAVTRMVRENTPAGQPVGDPVTATDEDTGDILTYTLAGNAADSSFAIDVTNGQVDDEGGAGRRTHHGEATWYTVTVTATDPFEADRPNITVDYYCRGR